MKLDHFNSIRKGGRYIDASDVTKSLIVHTVAKLKLLLKKSSRVRKHTVYRRVLPPIRSISTETTYSL